MRLKARPSSIPTCLHYSTRARRNLRWEIVMPHAARATLEQITPKMYIPFIQGTLMYAYEIANFEESVEKERAEGATFAAAVLPCINKINAIDPDLAYYALI